MSSQLQVTGEAKIRDIQGPVVANSGVITALDGAASQYVRGDGTLADFPTSTGGGSSVSYYLNSSVSQGTIGGVAYRELSKEPIIGTGTDIPIAANGYVASYLTDANDPDVLSIPGGNFNCEFYFSVSNDTGNPFFYAELYKYDGTTFTLLGSSVGVPEYINQGTIIAPYYFAIPVPTSALALTDRLAIRIYVNVDGRTVTLHTENSHLCQVVTTLSKGMVSLNNLTDQSQYLTTGTSGTDFNIASSGDTHTFNLPIASASNNGKLSSTDWSTFNNKVPYTGATADVDLGNFDLSASILKASVSSSASGSLILYTGSTGFTTGNTAVTLVSSPTQLNTLQIIFDIAGTQKFANIIGNSITSTRNYTLPDASGTFALTSNLSSYVPYTGATSNVDLGVYSLLGSFISANGSGGISGAIVIKQNGTMISGGSGEVTIGSANAGELSIFFGNTPYKATFLNTSLTASRTYTLPDITGTIALLEGTQTFSGAKTFSSNIKIDNGVDGNYIGFKQYATGSTATTGFTSLYAISTNVFGIGFGTTKAIQFDSTSLTAIRNYTFPDASGTIALTSDVPSVSGTATYIPVFTGTNSLGNSQIWNNGGIIGMGTNYSSPAFSVVASSGDTLTQGKLAINATSFSGASVLQVNGAATLTGALSGTSATFSSSVSGTSIRSSAVGSFGFNTANNGEFQIYATAADGMVMAGRGSTHDMVITNKSGSDVFRIPTGTTTANFVGNVGIGTSSPGNFDGVSFAGPFFDVAGMIQIKGTSANTIAALQFGGTTFRKALIYSTIGTEDPALIFATASSGSSSSAAERMRITTDGAVLVGASSTPSSSTSGVALQNPRLLGPTLFSSGNVSDSRSFVQFINANGVVGQITTSGTSTSYVTSSDYRLKQDLKDYNGLDLVSAIKTYDYEWKSDNTRSYGVIAHELQEVIPQAVYGEKDGEQMQGVDYSKIVPILIKSIQELQAQIEELSNKIVALESK